MGIRERIASLGGELEIASTPSQGTALSISIPANSLSGT
jgi:signal transduction histidine kinase